MVYFLVNHLSIDEQRVHTDLAWHSFRKTRKEFNLDVVENDGQYALFIGPEFFFTSFGYTGMQRYMNLKRITTTGVRPISQA
jgi:hypothetical protein